MSHPTPGPTAGLTPGLTTASVHTPGVAIALAAVAAFCFAGAAVLQHRAVSAGPDAGEGIGLSDLRSAARTPGWLVGLALAAGGTTLHAVALVLAPLSVVQPIGVLAVPIAVLISVVRTRRRPTSGVLVGVVLSISGVGAFVGLAAGTAVSSPAPDSALLVAGLVVAVAVGLLAAVGLARSGWVRCVTCATAGAVSFGLVSALVRAVSQTVAASPAELWLALLDPAVLGAVAGLACAVVVGGWLVQQAFASGPPEVVVACLTVVDPIVAVLLGVFLLGEGADTAIGTWLLLLAAASVATAGVVALASHHPDALARREAVRADVAGSRAGPRGGSGSGELPGPMPAPRREHVDHR